MKLSRGERERLKQLFNKFLAAQKRCSLTTEIGRLKAHTFAAMVVAFGFVLGDDGMFEANMNKWVEEIDSFGVIDEKMWSPENN
jgi:hypothetical protein